MRRPLGALIAVGLTAGLVPAASPSPSPVDSLVERLGDPAFPERQAAARELLKRGSAALPTLEAAVKVHPDAETRMRAAAIADQIRKADDAARLVTVKPVKLDYRNTPLGSALADLKAKTGVPLTLDNRRVADPLRPVTVQTDDLPAWAAIDAFCKAAGLVEVFREELGGAPGDAPLEVTRGGRRSSYYGPTQTPTEAPGNVPVVLADGKPELLPGDRSTAVRVLALPPSFAGNRVIRGAGQVVLNLDVTPLPGVRWTDTAAVRVHRAEDETYRPVTVSHRHDPKQNWNGLYDDFVFVGGAQAVFINGEVIYTGGAAARTNPRVVPVTLRTDDRAIKTLRVFEGVVVGEITQANQPLVTVENLPKLVGVTGHGPADNKLTVLDYKAEANQTVVKVRTESPNVWQLQRQGKRPGATFANLTVGDAPSSGQPDAVKVQFFDADGKSCGVPQRLDRGGMDDGFRQSREIELVFPKRPGTGAPVKLVVTGNKPVAVEVPFRMENVRLP